MKISRMMLSFPLLMISIASAAFISPSGARAQTPNEHELSQQTVVVYGTSLTAMSKWPKLLQDALDLGSPGRYSVVNEARSAEWSAWGLENFTSKVILHKPDLLIMEFAINDAYLPYSTSIDESLRNTKAMLDALKKALPNCKVVLMTTNHPVEVHLKDRPKISDYYEAYRQLSKEQQVPLSDAYPTWKALYDSDPIKYRLYVPDGIHPNGMGVSQITVPLLLKTLETIGIHGQIADHSNWKGSDVISIDFGSVDKQAGINRVTGQERGSVAVTEAGRAGRKPAYFDGCNNLSLDVADDWLPEGCSQVKATIDYFDSGKGNFRVEYDAQGPNSNPSTTSYKASANIKLTNTGEWKTAEVILNAPRFYGSQENGADLRVVCLNGQILFGRVSLERPKQ